MAEQSNAPRTDSERSKIKKELEAAAKKGFQEVHEYLKRKCDGWKNIKITIGVIGESHSGKSSFINTIRGLRPGEPGAAAVRNRECTREPTPYDYPKNPLVKLWDLPGVGTNNFPQETYMEKINVSRFDFFLILSKDSFSKLDSWLASELNKIGKGYFFVRTFMDRALEEEEYDKNLKIKERDQDGNLSSEMENFMNDIRNYCAEGLQFTNQTIIPIYLVSNWYPEMFEFSKLILAISDCFPGIQKEALLLSTNLCTEEIYKAKKKILQKRILYAALLSGAAGAVPIPGSGLAVDVPLVINEIKFYKEQFNLDAPNLETDFNNERLASLVKSIASMGTKTYVLGVVAKTVVSEVVEETSKALSWVTLGITSVVSAAASFGSTYYILTNELDKIADLSKRYLDLKVETMMR